MVLLKDHRVFPVLFHCVPVSCSWSCLPAAAQAVAPCPWEDFAMQFRGSVLQWEFELNGVDD